MGDMKERDYYVMLRRNKKIKLRELQEVLKISVSTLSRYERYEREITAEQEQLYKNFIDNYSK